MKHLSRPTILGFGHPSGALEDGARMWDFFSVSLYVLGIQCSGNIHCIVVVTKSADLSYLMVDKFCGNIHYVVGVTKSADLIYQWWTNFVEVYTL